MKAQRRASFVLKPVASMVRAAYSLINQFLAAYPSTDQTRKEVFNGYRPRLATSNQILGGNLSTLSAQCRHLERATPLGRGASDGFAAETVGSGISLMPNTGVAELDIRLLEAFQDWAEYACVDGTSLWCWQQIIPRELMTSGAALARWVILPERAAEGRIPLALLPLEIEWMSEFPVASMPHENKFIRGVEIDKLGRPVFYHLRHPEALLGEPGERVPASEIIHVFEKRRAQQVHGEPLMVPLVERTLQDSRLIETELKAANATAAPSIFIASDSAGMDANDTDDDGDPITDIPAGSVVRGKPGESVTSIENRRPSQQIAPFRETLKGDLAASCRLPRFWLDMDPSKANFSSMRMAQMMSKRSLSGIKEVIGKGGCGRLYERLFEYLLIIIGERMPARASDRARMTRYELRPDQPEYVDPVKDTAASEFAIANNLSTYDIELGSRGRDFTAVFAQRARENALLEKYGLPIPQPDTKPASLGKEQAGSATQQTDPDTGEPIDQGVAA